MVRKGIDAGVEETEFVALVRNRYSLAMANKAQSQ